MILPLNLFCSVLFIFMPTIHRLLPTLLLFHDGMNAAYPGPQSGLEIWENKSAPGTSVYHHVVIDSRKEEYLDEYSHYMLVGRVTLVSLICYRRWQYQRVYLDRAIHDLVWNRNEISRLDLLWNSSVTYWVLNPISTTGSFCTQA